MLLVFCMLRLLRPGILLKKNHPLNRAYWAGSKYYIKLQQCTLQELIERWIMIFLAICFVLDIPLGLLKAPPYLLGFVQMILH